MPKCPACQKEVSLIYQIIAPFKNPSLIARNWVIRKPLDKIMICGSCGKELTMAEESLSRCRVAGLQALTGLAFFLAGWAVVIRYLLPIDLSNKHQLFLFVSLPGFIAFFIAYISVWKAVVFKE